MYLAVMQFDAYQHGFLIVAGMFVSFTAWHGWRLGILRQIISILALAAAYIIGYFGGGRLGGLLRHFIDLPERALAVMGAVGMGFIIYCCITLLGVIAFKKTAQQKAGL